MRSTNRIIIKNLSYVPAMLFCMQMCGTFRRSSPKYKYIMCVHVHVCVCVLIRAREVCGWFLLIYIYVCVEAWLMHITHLFRWIWKYAQRIFGWLCGKDNNVIADNFFYGSALSSCGLKQSKRALKSSEVGTSSYELPYFGIWFTKLLCKGKKQRGKYKFTYV